MRVTDRIMYETTTLRMGQRSEEVQRAMDNISSGRSVNRPSDDPIRFERGRSADEDLTLLAAYGAVGEQAQGELDQVDQAFLQVQTTLARGLEISVTGASEQWAATSLDSMAVEVDGLFDHLVSMANSQAGGRYVFAGSLDSAPPFQPDGSYVGNNDSIEVEVAPGVRVDHRFDGQAIFNTSTGSLFEILDRLRVALRAGDTTTVQASVGELRTAIDEFGQQQAQVGAQEQRVSQALAYVEARSVDVEHAKSAALDTDVARAASQLALAQNGLEALQKLAPASLNMGLLRVL